MSSYCPLERSVDTHKSHGFGLLTPDSLFKDVILLRARRNFYLMIKPDQSLPAALSKIKSFF
jgi:hypothetical protein